MKILIKGARLFDPSLHLDKVSDLFIENGMIQGIGQNLNIEGAEVFQLDGKLVVPGLMDMHVHLREPGQEHKETIESGTRAAAHGGLVAVACMPNTDPPIDDVAGLHFVLSKAKDAPVDVYPIACVSKGQKGEEITEMAKLKASGAVAFSDDGKPVRTADLMRRALEYAKMLDLPIIDHCEEPTLAEGVMHEGYFSTLLGLRGIPSEAETIAVMRNLALAELTGGKIHLAHLSTARSVALVREAKKRGIKVTAEVTIHHLLLTHEALASFDTHYKINPPLRTEEDRQALIQGLADGTIDCLVSDHAPHIREDKEVEFDFAPSGISGVDILVPLALSELVNKEKITLKRFVEAMAVRPYQILKIKPPQIKEREEAILSILDLEKEETIHVENFHSKGKNAPYDGKKVKGTPLFIVRKEKIYPPQNEDRHTAVLKKEKAIAR
jgi:dihydroorotase